MLISPPYLGKKYFIKRECAMIHQCTYNIRNKKIILTSLLMSKVILKALSLQRQYDLK